MKSSAKAKQGLFEIDENCEIHTKKMIPRLNLCGSPKVCEAGAEINSLTSRMKRRVMVHRSYDFNLTASMVLTPKVIKADHTIVPVSTPRSNTFRKLNFKSTVTVNNREVSKNLLLDSRPM
jgi:hypothetical protein